ncbi:MAG: mechanosensitive ion channel domain-containing protein [Lysobacterales bacterium]
MKLITSRPARYYRRSIILFLALVLQLLTASELAAQNLKDGNLEQSDNRTTAAVIVDGRILFDLRGVTSFPAKERVKNVRDRIIAAARDKSFSVDDIKIVEEDERTSLYAGDKLLFSLFDMDAEIEQIDRKLLAQAVQVKVARVITDYRSDRSPKELVRHAAYAIGLTAVLVVLLWGILRLYRLLDAWALRHVHKSVKDLASKSHHLIQAEQLWTLVAGFLDMLRLLSIAILVYTYLNTVLGLFPWTRPAAIILFDLILNPVKSLWHGFVSSLPDLVFLAILVLVVRYILKLTRMFFTQVARGRIKLRDFDPDWALPTHKIVRILVIAFSIVIAYPYIPGSDSMAFKGVSVFIGVIFSLGSSSFIANMLAGLAMTYRGAFKEGERVKIGDIVGKVDEIKLMTTRIHTIKNESVIIPNSNILNTDVTNYSVMAREPGLVLHTTVGIGYDTPWRQVEAMLLLAAERTEGLKKEPAPFVQQTLMGDFAVSYEINAYCSDAAQIVAIRSGLHRSIQDVFNEYGVQIMSPAYEKDPETLKIVPPENWYTAPASKPPEK